MAKKTPTTEGRDGIAAQPAPNSDWELIRTALDGIRYGEVRVIIHDGAIVQIERVEKQRLS